MLSSLRVNYLDEGLQKQVELTLSESKRDFQEIFGYFSWDNSVTPKQRHYMSQPGSRAERRKASQTIFKFRAWPSKRNPRGVSERARQDLSKPASGTSRIR